MKFINQVVLALSLIIIPVQHSNAGVAAVAAIAGTGGAGSIALTGLATAGVGAMLTMSSPTCDGGGCIVFIAVGILIGMILLDEDNGAVEFSSIELSQATQIGVTKSEMDIYNAELEEANMVLSEVTSELTIESSQVDAKSLWANYRDMLSPETFKTMKSIVDHK